MFGFQVLGIQVVTVVYLNIEEWFLNGKLFSVAGIAATVSKNFKKGAYNRTYSPAFCFEIRPLPEYKTVPEYKTDPLSTLAPSSTPATYSFIYRVLE